MTTLIVIGCFACIAFIDSALRFGWIPLTGTLCNVGMAFGITVFPMSLLLLGTALWLGIALYQAVWQSDVIQRLAWVAISIGGSVNGIDRLVHGCVLDYIHAPFFPSFNLADMMLFLGVMVLIAPPLGKLLKRTLYVS